MFNIEHILGLKQSNVEILKDESNKLIENSRKYEDHRGVTHNATSKEQDIYLKNFKNYIWQPLDADKKKYRTSFSKVQLEKLESCFENAKYLTVHDRVVLSKNLKLSDNQIKTWYQNRRTKWKKELNRHHSPCAFNINSGRTFCDESRGGSFHKTKLFSSQYQKHDRSENVGATTQKINESSDQEESLFEPEEKYFKDITDPYLYDLVKKWYFNIFMHVYTTPHMHV